MSNTAKLDQILDSVQDLQVAALEEGFDDAATQLGDVIEQLQAVAFAEENGEDEIEDEED